MTSTEAVEVERYMRSEADRLLARDPSEFIPGLRETVDRIMAGAEDKPSAMLQTLELESGTTTVAVDVNGIPSEWVFNENADDDRRILYLHGGGLVAGSITTHRAMASRIAKKTGSVVLIPDYRLAPENPYPAALDDSVSALNWLAENSSNAQQKAKQLFVMGDSAGGGLTLSLLVNRRDQLTCVPTAAATFSALTDFTGSGKAMKTNRESDILLSREAIVGLGMIYGGGTAATESDLSPLFGKIEGLPPLHMQASDTEVLLDDTLSFFEKHEASGGEGELKIYPKMVHVWQGFAPYLPEAEKSLNELASFFKQFN